MLALLLAFSGPALLAAFAAAGFEARRAFLHAAVAWGLLVVALTEGLSLFRSMEKPLGKVASRFQDFMEKDRSDRVLISVDYAFASFWLLPRIPRMREALGTTNICVLTSQNPVENAGNDTDITLHMAGSHQVRASETLVLSEQVSAVCSPTFKQENFAIVRPYHLLEQPSKLIHLNSPSADTRWCNWEEWMESLDVTIDHLAKDTVFSNYEMIVRAAIDGQGVALGWHGLIEPLLRRHDLTMLMPDFVTTGRGYYINLHQTKSSRMASDLHEWIITEAQSSK